MKRFNNFITESQTKEKSAGNPFPQVAVGAPVVRGKPDHKIKPAGTPGKKPKSREMPLTAIEKQRAVGEKMKEPKQLSLDLDQKKKKTAADSGIKAVKAKQTKEKKTEDVTTSKEKKAEATSKGRKVTQATSKSDSSTPAPKKDRVSSKDNASNPSPGASDLGVSPEGLPTDSRGFWSGFKGGMGGDILDKDKKRSGFAGQQLGRKVAKGIRDTPGNVLRAAGRGASAAGRGAKSAAGAAINAGKRSVKGEPLGSTSSQDLKGFNTSK